MNKIRKTLIAVFSVLFLLCAAIFAVGCDLNVGSDAEHSAPPASSGTQEGEDKSAHSLSVSVNDEGLGTYSVTAPTDGEEYLNGTPVTLTVAPNEDYDAEVIVNGEPVALVDNAYSFSITEDTEIVVTYSYRYTVSTYIYDGEGTVNLSTPKNGQRYAKGEEVTVTVSPAEGWCVKTFSMNGEDVTLKNGAYTFAIEDRTYLFAEFIKGFSLSVENPAPDKGTVKLNGEAYAEALTGIFDGTEYQLTVETAGGNSVKAVYANERLIPYHEDKTLGRVWTIKVTANLTVKIVYDDYYSVTLPDATALKGGTASLDAEPTTEAGYLSGTRLTLTVSPEVGYSVTVKKNGAEVTLIYNSYSFIVTEDTSFEITFTKRTYTVTITQNNLGFGKSELDKDPTEGKYEYGTELTLTMTPSEGFDFDYLNVGGKRVDAKETEAGSGVYTYTFTVEGDVSLYVCYKYETRYYVRVEYYGLESLLSLTLPKSVYAGAVVDSKDAAEASLRADYYAGQDVTVTVDASKLTERILYYSVNNGVRQFVPYSAENTEIKFESIADNQIVRFFTAAPKAPTYTVTTKIDGAAAPDFVYDYASCFKATYAAGSYTLTLTSPADTDEYRFNAWEDLTVNSTAIADLENITFAYNNDGMEVALTAGWTTVLTVTPPEAGGNGTVSVTGATRELFAKGDSVTISVEPNAGYRVKSISLNGEPVSFSKFGAVEHTISSLAEDTVIAVEYQEIVEISLELSESALTLVPSAEGTALAEVQETTLLADKDAAVTLNIKANDKNLIRKITLGEAVQYDAADTVDGGTTKGCIPEFELALTASAANTLTVTTTTSLTVTFSFNDDSNATETLTRGQGDKVALPALGEHTKELYKFVGWQLAGTEDILAEGAVVEVGETDATYNGVWEGLEKVYVFLTETDGIYTASLSLSPKTNEKDCYYVGEEVTLTVNVIEGYKLLSVLINGEEYVSKFRGSTCTFTVLEETSIEITTRVSNTILTFKNGNEVIYTTNVDAGTSFNFENIQVSEEANHQFVGWSLENGDDTLYNASNPYTVTAEDVTFVAVFKEYYYVTVNDGDEVANGSVAVDSEVDPVYEGVVAYYKCATVTVTLTAAEGYMIKSLTVALIPDTGEVVAGTPVADAESKLSYVYTIDSLENDVKVTVEFVELPHLSVDFPEASGSTGTQAAPTQGIWTSVEEAGEQASTLTFGANTVVVNGDPVQTIDSNEKTDGSVVYYLKTAGGKNYSLSWAGEIAGYILALTEGATKPVSARRNSPAPRALGDVTYFITEAVKEKLHADYVEALDGEWRTQEGAAITFGNEKGKLTLTVGDASAQYIIKVDASKYLVVMPHFAAIYVLTVSDSALTLGTETYKRLGIEAYGAVDLLLNEGLKLLLRIKPYGYTESELNAFKLRIGDNEYALTSIVAEGDPAWKDLTFTISGGENGVEKLTDAEYAVLLVNGNAAFNCASSAIAGSNTQTIDKQTFTISQNEGLKLTIVTDTTKRILAYGASDLLLDGTMVKVIIRLQSDDYKTQDINDEITLRIDGKEFKPNLVNQDNGNWYLIYFTLVGGADANTLASSAFNTYFVELYAANEELLSSCPSTGITDVNKHQELDYRAYELAIVDGVLKLTISDVTPKTYTVKVVTEGMPEGTQAPKLTNQDADVGESVPVDATLTLTVTPVEGYTISVSVDHGEVKDNQNNTYEITLSANATITVKYEKDATEPDPEKEIIGCNDSNIVYISDTEFDIYFRIKVTGYADANAVKNDVKLMIEGITAEALNADDNIFISTDSVHQLRYRINKSQLTAMESGKSYELTLRYASGTKTYKKPASSINTAQFSVTLGNAQYTVKLEDTAVVLAYEELTVVEKKATAYAGSELLKIGSVVRLTINITLQGFTKAEMQGAKLNVANATLMNDSNLNESNNSVFNFDVTNVDIAEEPYKLVLIIGEVQIDVLSAGLAPNYSQDEGEKNYKISIGSGSPPQQLYLTVSAKESGGGGEEHTGTVKSVSGAKLDRAILEVCFDVEGYTAEDLKEVEFHYINLETQQDNNYGQAPSGIRSENGLYVVRFEGLDRISAIGRYRVEFRFKGENYSPAEGASGGPFEFDQFKHTLLNENGVLILVVESLSSASANDIKKADNEGAALGFKDQWSYYLYFGNVTKKTFADGKLEFAFDGKNDNNNWWGIQLYYVDSSVTSGYYSFSFTIYSKNGGTYRLFSDQSDETERTESFVLTAGETKQFTSKVIPFATNRATVTIYMGAGADTNIVADEITITNLVITPATDDASNKTGERTLTEGNDTVIDGTYQDGQSLAVTVSDNDGHTFTFGINGYKINGKEEYRRDTSLSDPHPLEFSEGSSPELSEGSSINITLDYSGGELLITYQVGEITIYTVTISGLSGELRLDAELA